MRALLALLVFAAAAPAAAKPAPVRVKARVATKAAPTRMKAPTLGTDTQTFAIGGDVRSIKDLVGKQAAGLSVAEETASKIAKLLRGPLRNADTGLYVADARSGQMLFAVNADERLNPASNVKMISTATSLELLGPTFRYPTRLLGPLPQDGVVHGDVYLLGSYDPTLTAADLVEIADAVAARGVTSIEGSIVIGADPTRDGIYRALIPVEITGGEAGQPAIATSPTGGDLVSITMNAKTSGAGTRPRLAYKLETTTNAAGLPRIHVTIAGAIGKGVKTTYPIATRERTATAGYALKSALVAHGIRVTGDLKVHELAAFVGDTVAGGSMPLELGRHESLPLAAIVTQVNKWSINWLADRVVMTAAALTHQQPPSMDLALDAMYAWLERHAHLGKSDLLVDTGSGLSYHTQISPTELVAVVRSAAGYGLDLDPAIGAAWMGSLSIAGTDGTLRHRVRGADVRVRVRGKTGTLSTAIAMSGLVDVDPEHPIVFSLVTNTKRPLSKAAVRRAHDQVVGALCSYVARTSKAPVANPLTLTPAQAPAPELAPPPGEDGEEAGHDRDPALDAETSGQQ